MQMCACKPLCISVFQAKSHETNTLFAPDSYMYLFEVLPVCVLFSHTFKLSLELNPNQYVFFPPVFIHCVYVCACICAYLSSITSLQAYKINAAFAFYLMSFACFINFPEHTPWKLPQMMEDKQENQFKGISTCN